MNNESNLKTDDRAVVELSLVIPAFNEKQIITRNIDELRDWLRIEMPELSYEILVVDDGSTDGMGPLLDEYIKKYNDTSVIHHDRNLGRGRGVRTGFENSIGRYVICFDADLSYAPFHIQALLKPLQDGYADITLASAYHKEGSVENVPFSRALLSRWGNRVFRASVGKRINTVTCIVRGFTRQVINELELINDGKELHIEILQKALLLGYRLVEIAAHLKWRDRDRSKVTTNSILPPIPFLSMSSSIASHLVYNWMLRPGFMLFTPMLILAIIAASGIGTLLFSFWQKLFSGTANYPTYDFYQALRDTLINANLTMFLVFISIIFLAIFAVFYFTSHQNRKNFEETYVLLTRLNARLKQLEEKERN